MNTASDHLAVYNIISIGFEREPRDPLIQHINRSNTRSPSPAIEIVNLQLKIAWGVFRKHVRTDINA